MDENYIFMTDLFLFFIFSKNEVEEYKLLFSFPRFFSNSIVNIEVNEQAVPCSFYLQ